MPKASRKFLEFHILF